MVFTLVGDLTLSKISEQAKLRYLREQSVKQLEETRKRMQENNDLKEFVKHGLVKPYNLVKMNATIGLKFGLCENEGCKSPLDGECRPVATFYRVRGKPNCGCKLIK